MTRRIDSQQQSAEHKLQTEIQRVKETALAAEKIRRERWVRDNTKKIKVQRIRIDSSKIRFRILANANWIPCRS